MSSFDCAYALLALGGDDVLRGFSRHTVRKELNQEKEKFMTDSPKADAAVVPAATVAFAAPAADTAVKK